MLSSSHARLILLPGLLCDARIFARQVDAFPDAFAINGFGTLRTLQAMARHALDQVEGSLSLLGHSMGARVALEMLRLAPERIERIALVSTGVHDRRAGEAEKRHALLDLGRTHGAEALVDRWLPPMVAPEHRQDARLMEYLRKMCVDLGVDAFAAQIAALLARPDVETLLPTIQCPTLVAVGEEDNWSPPAQHQAIAAAIPGAQLVVVAGAGHMLPAEAPDALNDAIATWLAMPIIDRPKITGE
jgi:pimeloyl-ACP methyl ester carboxylesterase